MSNPTEASTLVQRIEAAMIAGDGPALIALGDEVKRFGRSETARSNRTNKKKTAQKACEDWVAKIGVDPITLHAMATMLHESRSDPNRKWNISVEVALMVLRPDLSHRRGIFQPGAEVSSKFRRQPSARNMTEVDQCRNAVIRKLRSAMNYREGPLFPRFEETTSQARQLGLRELIASHRVPRTAPGLGHVIANFGR